MERLAQALRMHYGLTLYGAAHIDYGMWEESFRIETDQGRLFAKRFLRKDRKSDVMLRGLQLSESLRTQGFPAPRIVRTHSGDLLACDSESGDRYQVTEWAEGRAYHPGELPAAGVEAMGALAGRLHRLLGAAPVDSPAPLPSPAEALQACQAMLARYDGRPESFAAVAREVLAAQIDLLAALPPDFAGSLPTPALGGPIFNSYWVEQLLFRPDGEVSALVDWTDGAGKVRPWADELDTAMHLSAFGLDEAVAFARAYQSEHPLPRQEWRAVAAGLCYGHLAQTNFLGAWFARPYRRMADWEEIAALWHRQVPERFRRRAEWSGALEAVGVFD